MANNIGPALSLVSCCETIKNGCCIVGHVVNDKYLRYLLAFVLRQFTWILHDSYLPIYIDWIMLYNNDISSELNETSCNDCKKNIRFDKRTNTFTRFDRV